MEAGFVASFAFAAGGSGAAFAGAAGLEKNSFFFGSVSSALIGLATGSFGFEKNDSLPVGLGFSLLLSVVKVVVSLAGSTFEAAPLGSGILSLEGPATGAAGRAFIFDAPIYAKGMRTLEDDA